MCNKRSSCKCLFSQLTNGLSLHEGSEHFHSISSTNLIIKTMSPSRESTKNSPQKSISQITKTVEASRGKQLASHPTRNWGQSTRENVTIASKVAMRSERHSEEASSNSAKSELKQVFSRLQHKSKAQNVEQYSNGDEPENTSSSNLNSMYQILSCKIMLCIL